MNSQIYNSFFKGIFDGLDILSSTNAEYKKINQYPIYYNQQLLFSLPCEQSRVIAINYEVVIINNATNNISIQSKSFYWKKPAQITQKMNFMYDELSSDVSIDVQVENNVINLYANSAHGADKIYTVSGIVQYNTL